MIAVFDRIHQALQVTAGTRISSVRMIVALASRNPF